MNRAWHWGVQGKFGYLKIDKPRFKTLSYTFKRLTIYIRLIIISRGQDLRKFLFQQEVLYNRRTHQRRMDKINLLCFRLPYPADPPIDITHLYVPCISSYRMAGLKFLELVIMGNFCSYLMCPTERFKPRNDQELRQVPGKPDSKTLGTLY